MALYGKGLFIKYVINFLRSYFMKHFLYFFVLLILKSNFSKKPAKNNYCRAMVGN